MVKVIRMKIEFNPLSIVKNNTTERMDANWGNVISKISLPPELSGAFKGLETFSHIIILTFLHEATFETEKHLLRHPRNNRKYPQVGIFSQRAKNRPNPIGVTSLKIEEIKGDNLIVKGLDAINGTPVLDIKIRSVGIQPNISAGILRNIMKYSFRLLIKVSLIVHY